VEQHETWRIFVPALFPGPAVDSVTGADRRRRFADEICQGYRRAQVVIVLLSTPVIATNIGSEENSKAVNQDLTEML